MIGIPHVAFSKLEFARCSFARRSSLKFNSRGYLKRTKNRSDDSITSAVPYYPINGGRALARKDISINLFVPIIPEKREENALSCSFIRDEEREKERLPSGPLNV